MQKRKQPNKFFLLLFSALVPSFLAFGQAKMPKRLGDFTSYQQKGNVVFIRTTYGKLQVSAMQDDVIHVRVVKDSFASYANYAVVQDQTIPFATITESSDYLNLSTSSVDVNIKKSPLTIQFLDKDGKVLNADDEGFGTTWIGDQVTCYKKLLSDEKFIGLGEKTGPLNRRGQGYVNWNNDDYAYEVDDDPIYESIPFYMGIHGKQVYGIFFDNTAKSTFNFGASNDRFSSFGADSGEMNYYFFGAGNVADIMNDYTWLTGRMELPPIWSLGFQQSRWSYYPDKEVMRLAKTFREKKIPADVIYLDIHYMDHYKVFTWNKERFPEPQKMIHQLNDMGFHLAVIVDPGIKKEAGYHVYEEGKQDGVFLKYPDGSLYTGQVWPGWCHFTDFTEEKGRKFWGKQFSALTDVGVEGFWNDMNEPATWGNQFPDLVEFSMEGNKGTHKVAHNIYGMEMSRATREGVRKLQPNKRPLILTRAGFAGIQRYSAVWTGDNVASNDHMLLSARMVASMGLSGLAFAGPDMGGFSGKRTSDLFIRWLSQGIFTPFFRNHATYNSRDHEPWAYGEDIEGWARDYLDLRYELMPYIYSAFYEASKTGMPIARSLAIDYTFDDKIYEGDFQNQYLFGSDFLIAPTRSEQKYNKVYLPEGSWYNYWTGQKYQGKQEVLVPAPLDKLPVFVKGGAVIPMQSKVQYTLQKPSDTLDIQVYYGKNKTESPLYEDDGVSYDFQHGAYNLRHIHWDGNAKTLSLSKVEGDYASKFTYYRFIFHGFPQTMTVKEEGSRKKAQLDQRSSYTIANEKAAIQLKLDF